MKSRTSFSELAPLKKDLFRFTPVWAVYFVVGISVMLSLTDWKIAGEAAHSMAATLQPFVWINLIYAGVCAQLLFGDLYNSRLCNALHAMPVRREKWFFCHIAAGLLFSLVPTALGTAILLPRLGELWSVGLWWLLGMELQYLFFFGTAVLAMLCCGSRFAMVTVYGVLNFGSMLAWWFVSAVYEPLLFGIVIPMKWFRLLSPASEIMAGGIDSLLNMERIRKNGSSVWEFRGPGELWNYLIVCAVAGGVFLLLALWLYRRRHLEKAGDFIALKPLAPVFCLILSLCTAALFTLFGTSLTGSGSFWAFLVIGLLVGYLGSKMLQERSIKIFRPATFVKAIVLTALVVGSVFAVKADPLKMEEKVPEISRVQQVEVDGLGRYYGKDLVLRDRQMIEQVQELHRWIIRERPTDRSSDSVPQEFFHLTFRYTLTGGRTMTRDYRIFLTKEQTEKLRFLASLPEHVLGAFLNNGVQLQEMSVVGNPLPASCWEKLMEALRTDCILGTMAQEYRMHEEGSKSIELYIEGRTPQGDVIGNHLDIYPDAMHTAKVLQQHRKVWDHGEYPPDFLDAFFHVGPGGGRAAGQFVTKYPDT